MNKKTFSEYVKKFEFRKLFVDLGCGEYTVPSSWQVEQETLTIQGIGEKQGFAIVLCLPDLKGNIPLSRKRRKLKQNFRKIHREHLIIYQDAAKTRQIWQYTIPEPGRPEKTREIRYSKEQDPEILYQRARGLLLSLDEEKNITLVDVLGRFSESSAWNSEKVIKGFYTDFKKEHNAFLGFISGIDDAKSDQDNRNKQWYASLMLSRLMFCYFIQKRGYLDDNIHYLREKLKEAKKKAGNDKLYSFYRDFLLPLFHHGFGQPESRGTHSIDLGMIPHLNGGLFDMHELERQYTEIDIRDEAFERIFAFFDQWNWHLDTRVGSRGKDINPDVIGYIFEKYINDRAAMGAYYTKEDITEYIGKNTIIPFLFDRVEKTYPKAFEKGGTIWSFLQQSGDAYIYATAKKGIPEGTNIFNDLPKEVKAGFAPDLEKELVKDETSPHLWEIRMCWNQRAPEEIALPTETYRELIERRIRYAKVLSQIVPGRITAIDDLIIYNLNIRRFAQNLLEESDDPVLIRRFFEALKSITILDPTCGSGAFLFAALNILEPLYETCIERMEQFVAEEAGMDKFFHEVLAEVNSQEHPNLKYYIYKTIILNNLYGVDIMHEAVEIAKLRLYLKMVGAVDIDMRKRDIRLEPLPDVDFNIRTGNSLVGFVTEDELRKAVKEKEPLYAENIISQLNDQFTTTAKAFKAFQESRHIPDTESESQRKAKSELQKCLESMNAKLNRYLASAYGIHEHNVPDKGKMKYTEWFDSHRPFHWYAEFHEIIAGKGGFDVIIGNPPYVEYKDSTFEYTIRDYTTFETRNVYSYCIEKAKKLMNNQYYFGMILPLSAFATKNMSRLIEFVESNFNQKILSFFHFRPSRLFNSSGSKGASIATSILIGTWKNKRKFSTGINKFDEVTRKYLFENINYTSDTSNYQTEMFFCFPKLSNELENGIINKVRKDEKISKLIQSRSGKEFICYRTAGGLYWKVIVNFDWPFKVTSNKKKYLRDNLKSAPLIVFLNSSIQWVLYCISFDTLNFKDYYIFSLPFSYPYNEDLHEYESLSEKLMNDYRAKAENKARKKTPSYTIYARKSKNIIDQIDTLLARHYGFTEEELDFIINYDIKYRMGTELGALLR